VYPDLFGIGPFQLRSYGLFMALGFAAGTIWLVRRGRNRGLPTDRVLDLVAAMIVAGLLGARLLYAVVYPQTFEGSPWRIFWPVLPDGTVGLSGLIYYGGILGAIPVVVLLARQWRLPLRRLLDAGAPALALGTAIGRLGCFFNGCCFGLPASVPPGVIFPVTSPAGLHAPGVPLHPVQLYMSASALVIALLLVMFERSRGMFDGALFGLYLVMTGLARGVEDLFRYYEPDMRLVEAGGVTVSVNHLIGFALLTAGVLILIGARRWSPPSSKE
jgi:phosphatidylglycerol---prolipoprotein diacylglyceryl transferase